MCMANAHSLGRYLNPTAGAYTDLFKTANMKFFEDSGVNQWPEVLP